MNKNLSCLEEGIFALKTLKKLDDVFDRENEISWLRIMFDSRAWFSVCGLRRTGKTTLVRSVASSIGSFYVVYINVWKIPEEALFDGFLEALRDELVGILEKQKLGSLAKRISRLSFLGVSVELRDKAQLKLINALEKILKKNSLILIVDEAPSLLLMENSQRFFAAIHDTYASNIVTVFTGSIVTLKQIYESSENDPLYGRIEEELVLEPLNEYMSRRYLEVGFEQCGVSPPDELIERAVLRLGGFPGWLTLLGRIAVRRLFLGKKLDVDSIFSKLEQRASKIVLSELARFMRQRRNFKNYIRILRKIALDGESTLTELATAINRDPSTVVYYLEQLQIYGIIKKQGKHYRIADPLIRRTIQSPKFEREIKLRL